MYDIKNLAKVKRLDEKNPETMKAFWAFDKAAFAPGAIDVINKQLMAVAVALTTQCPYCFVACEICPGCGSNGPDAG
jgi:alkylhydroperoxidase/carboxymuconolactone decarboxylase family protein YurZ